MFRLQAVVRNQLIAARRFLRRDDAATTVEYAVLLSLIVVTSIASLTALGPVLLAAFQSSAQTVGTYGVP